MDAQAEVARLQAQLQRQALQQAALEARLAQAQRALNQQHQHQPPQPQTQPPPPPSSLHQKPPQPHSAPPPAVAAASAHERGGQSETRQGNDWLVDLGEQLDRTAAALADPSPSVAVPSSPPRAVVQQSWLADAAAAATEDVAPQAAPRAGVQQAGRMSATDRARQACADARVVTPPAAGSAQRRQRLRKSRRAQLMAPMGSAGMPVAGLRRAPRQQPAGAPGALVAAGLPTWHPDSARQRRLWAGDEEVHSQPIGDGWSLLVRWRRPAEPVSSSLSAPPPPQLCFCHADGTIQQAPPPHVPAPLADMLSGKGETGYVSEATLRRLLTALADGEGPEPPARRRGVSSDGEEVGSSSGDDDDAADDDDLGVDGQRSRRRNGQRGRRRRGRRSGRRRRRSEPLLRVIAMRAARWEDAEMRRALGEWEDARPIDYLEEMRRERELRQATRPRGAQAERRAAAQLAGARPLHGSRVLLAQ
jgi:hypothetical protein